MVAGQTLHFLSYSFTYAWFLGNSIVFAGIFKGLTFVLYGIKPEGVLW